MYDDEENQTKNTVDDVYLTYNFKHDPRDYPITPYKSTILKAIDANPFVVLQGPTATGKTTQVPQYILDNAFEKQKNCQIVIAQPRRIAASSNAKRVSDERNWQLGTVVGYRIGFDERKYQSEDTRILFCTTGILLDKLIQAKNFLNFTHIILDEVHERNKDMDFLFVVIRKLFATIKPRSDIKVILMSATIQAEQVFNFF